MAPKKPEKEKSAEEIAAEINAQAGAPNPTADDMTPSFAKAKRPGSEPSAEDLDAAAKESAAKDATKEAPAPAARKLAKPAGVPHRAIDYNTAHPFPDHAAHAPGKKPEYHE
ncbi:MAG: hypothetical protein WAN65_01220 [Candidatus Sulfotelmatobacter sp.]